MQLNEEDGSVLHELQERLDYEFRDELRGAVVQALVKLLLSMALFYFVFVNSGFTLQLIGGILLGLVVIGTYPTIFLYTRFVAHRW